MQKTKVITYHYVSDFDTGDIFYIEYQIKNRKIPFYICESKMKRRKPMQQECFLEPEQEDMNLIHKDGHMDELVFEGIKKKNEHKNNTVEVN